MTILCRPAVALPEHVVTLSETLELFQTMHSDHPRFELLLPLLRDCGVETRHLVLPLRDALMHPGLAKRNTLYEHHAKLRVPPVVTEALDHARLSSKDIDAIVLVSCTGFLMPSLTAFMINELGFRCETRQIPIAQMGCAAGATAIALAHTFVAAYPDANVLIVACEFCSLCYQPTDLAASNLIMNSMFADAVAAAVVRGRGGRGVNIEATASTLIPATAGWSAYTLKETGFHFKADKRAPDTLEAMVPGMRALAKRQGLDASGLDFYILHAGGPRAIKDLARLLVIEEEKLNHSRATLVNCGNIASAFIFEALRRTYDAGGIDVGATGMIIGLGPGITGEFSVGRWNESVSI